MIYRGDDIRYMNVVNATQFRKDLFSMLDSAVVNNEKVTITTKNGNAVLVSEEDWNGILETMYLMSDPEMGDIIREARKEYPDECTEWRDCRKDTM